MYSDRVLIIGGGISGLATAYYLGQAGLPCVLIEKSKRLGGLIKTDHLLGCDLEAGPDSFIASKTAVAELAGSLGNGLEARIIGSNDAARRVFLVRNGQLVAMPRGMSLMVPGEWGPMLTTPLLGVAAKLRLLRETFAKPHHREGDFPVGELVADHFGKDVLERIAEPLLVGVYGGDPRSLSARSVLPRFVAMEENSGSLIRAVRREKRKASGEGSLFKSFAGGMQTLVDSLSHAVLENTTVIHEEVAKVERFDGGWRVRLGADSISGANLVLACPAWVGAKLLAKSAPDVAAELAGISYSSAILVNFVFEKSGFGHALDGFGFLVPASEAFTLAAATFVNTKFPSRVAPERVAVRGFIVGTKAEGLMGKSDDEIAAIALRELSNIMGITASPVLRTVHRWPQSMPQYVVGHAARIERLHRTLELQPGLHVAGNYLAGVGIPDSVSRAKEVAKQIVPVVV